MNLVEVEGLRKSFGDKRVLRGFDLSLAAGSVYVLLGRNGAGKSTFVNILLDALEADSGTVKRNFDVKHDVGAVFQEDCFPGGVRVKDLAALQAYFFSKKPDIDSLLTEFDLSGEKDQLADSLSGGQKRRLSFLLSLIPEPKLLILDEPAAGMDYQSVEKFNAKIKRLKSEGRTILLVTHDLYQIESFADRILLLDSGVVEENISVADLNNEIVYQFPASLVPAGLVPASLVSSGSGFLSDGISDDIVYADSDSVVVSESRCADFAAKAGISDPARFRRAKRAGDIFRRISFLEGGK